MRADQRDLLAAHAQARSFGQPKHRHRRVQRAELGQTLGARFATVSGRMRVGVVRVDLERDQVQAVEAARVGDGHVVRGADGGARQVGTGAPAQIRRTRAHAALDHVQQALATQLPQQVERVAAPHDDDGGIFQRGHGVCCTMQAFNGQARVRQGRGHQCGVVVPAARDAGKRHKHGRRAGRQRVDQFADVRQGMYQVAGVAAGIAE
ncbi:hypothetical protein D3C73_1237400 [compost metagenome]